MDVSIRKPLIATCSADKSIRLWNFLTLTCELCKFFTEEPLSVSIHPSGYFLLAGFSDKLRLMNILLDELRTIREFPIRSSRECCFSNGGHMLAASQGSVICIYNVWTYELVTTLKGHNGKILSLRWSNGDVCLISCGSDGAVYIWNLATMKRENEFIMKGVTFASAVDLNETTYAAGSDRTIKVITESMLVKDIVMPVECTQLAISHTGKMFFAGTQLGNICAIRFPIPKEALDAEKDELCQEHVVHSGPVIKLRITFDDKYMVSAGEDGCLCLFRISELDTGSSRSSSKQSEWTYTQEQLVTKSDHLERISNINDLKTRLEEVNMEYDYQLRLKTMNQQDSLKELTTEKTKIAESLKINLVVQRGEKEKTEARNRGLYSALVVANQNEYRALENKYSQELMNEYETFQNTQTSLRRKQEAWEFEVKEFEKNKKDAINSLTSHYERLCISRHKELVKLQEDAASQRRENSEHIKQQQEDLDEEIINFQKQYEVLMKAEREVNFRLKGENGIMKKKFLVLTKEIEDNKLEMVKLTENENRLRKIMSILEREVDGFRNEMIERDKMIQEQEKRVYELKKSNQELEKYKFVLDYKIKDLKRQIEPREEKISDLKERIKEINLKLGSLREKEEGMKETQKQLETSLEQCIQNKIKEHQRLNSLKQLVKQFQTDLTLTMDYIQEPAVLKRLGLNLRNKFCKNMAPTKQQELGAGEIELQNQQAVLQKNIQKLKKESTQNTKKFRQEHFEWVQGNKKLLTEIKELQKIKASLPPLSTSYTYQVSVSASGTQ
ncbi:hypothetical protein HMI54_007888 [Coelomomyces lativittatus]|nr:hypothetical protein HMI54_007888 [Coelomomyces lativittatus]